jgi:hypothetical protein
MHALGKVRFVLSAPWQLTYQIIPRNNTASQAQAQAVRLLLRLANHIGRFAIIGIRRILVSSGPCSECRGDDAYKVAYRVHSPARSIRVPE